MGESSPRLGTIIWRWAMGRRFLDAVISGTREAAVLTLESRTAEDGYLVLLNQTDPVGCSRLIPIPVWSLL